MDQNKLNKDFISSYFTAISGIKKTRSVLEKYISDEALIGHIIFFEAVFPAYSVVADEMIAEDNKVVVKARLKGVHEGELNGILPTHRSVEFAFAIKYEIEHEKITGHWLIADQMTLMEQIGDVPSAQAVH